MTAVPASATPALPPAPPTPSAPRVYRSAAGDNRGKIILASFAVWIVAHVGIALLHKFLDAAIKGMGFQRPSPSNSAFWFSPLELQVGVSFFETTRGSFLTSMAWQIGGYFLILAAFVVLLTQRLRIIALLFPLVFFLVAALFQCISYNVYHSYMGQASPLLTLALMSACLLATWTLAPRNSGWPELRKLTREFLRETVRSPGSLIFGPIFSKEVRVMGRHRGTYWLRFLYPLGLLGLITIVYVSATSSINQFSAGADRIQRLQEIAPNLALFISWAQYLMLLFLAAALTSSAVCDERRTRTLASLMTTPMNASQIVMGKLTSRLVQLLIIGLISIPFLLAIRVFGGLEAGVIIALIAITITSTFLMASLGILASVWSRKPAGAIALAVLLFMLLTLSPVIIAVLWAMGTRGGPPDEIFAFSSPMAMMGATMYITGGGPQFILRDLWVANSVVNICLGLAAMFVAAVSLRGVMLSETAFDAPSRKSRRKKRRVAGAPLPAPAADPSGAYPDAPPTVAPDAPSETHEILVERDTVVPDQPVLWRELRQPAVGSRRIMIIAACIIAVLVLWLYSESGPQRRDPHMAAVVIGMFLIIIQAAVASTPTITGEKDSSTWQTLLATPLTGAQILFPKLIGSVKKLWFISAILFAELAIGMLFGRVKPIVFFHLTIIIVSTGIFLGGTGILFSLLARRSNAAAIFNVLLGGFLWIGIPILGSLASEFLLAPRTGRGNILEDATFVINPMAMAVVANIGATEDRGYWSADMPSGTDLGLFEYTGLLLLVGALGSALGLAAIGIACSRFNRLSGRSS